MTLSVPLPTATPKRGRPRKSTQEKHDYLLRAAAELMASKGFGATAIRDVGRKVDSSLAGMYYYFSSKEELLYRIQHRTFASLLESQEAAAAQSGTPVERLERLIVGHLAFFARHPNEMKICTAELESLTGDYYQRVLDVRRRYTRLMGSVVAEVLNGGAKRSGKETSASRRVTLFIFGMLNWTFMWYDRAKDGPIDKLGGEMLELVLNGIGKGARQR